MSSRPELSPLIVAHRGSSALAPENTLAAFKRAIEDGAEGIEFDVQLSVDGVPVVIHDFDLGRTAGIDAVVVETSSEKLRGTDVGSWFNTQFPELAQELFSRQHVPLLADTLDYLSGYDGRLYVELKCAPADALSLARAVAVELKKMPKLDRVIVKSFSLSVIPIMRTLMPQIATAALFAPEIMRVLRRPRYMLAVAEQLGANEVSLHHSLASAKVLDNAARAGLAVTVWTVDGVRWIRKARRHGIRALITNDPGRLLAKREGLG
jgi:glycerophosphoryl diester phosphodiesterase